MVEVLRGYRLKIKELENEAGIRIDGIMSSPVLNQEKLKAMNQMIIRVISIKSMDALQEGVKFGRYIKKKNRG